MKNKTKPISQASAKEDRWEYFRKKAEEQRTTTKKLQDISEEEKERIFLERSQNLRREKGKTREDKDLVKIISFHISGECFGIEVKSLQEVYEVNQITRIPCTPKTLVGLINYRGTVLTIIDLKVLFHLNDTSPDTPKNTDVQGNTSPGTSTKKILIVEYANARAGIIIDQLDNLLELPKAEIQPVSPFFLEKNKIVKSEVKLNQAPLLLIDPDELLSDERLIVNEDV